MCGKHARPRRQSCHIDIPEVVDLRLDSLPDPFIFIVGACQCGIGVAEHVGTVRTDVFTYDFQHLADGSVEICFQSDLSQRLVDDALTVDVVVESLNRLLLRQFKLMLM